MSEPLGSTFAVCMMLLKALFLIVHALSVSCFVPLAPAGLGCSVRRESRPVPRFEVLGSCFGLPKAGHQRRMGLLRISAKGDSAPCTPAGNVVRSEVASFGRMLVALGKMVVLILVQSALLAALWVCFAPIKSLARSEGVAVEGRISHVAGKLWIHNDSDDRGSSNLEAQRRPHTDCSLANPGISRKLADAKRYMTTAAQNLDLNRQLSLGFVLGFGFYIFRAHRRREASRKLGRRVKNEDLGFRSPA